MLHVLLQRKTCNVLSKRVLMVVLFADMIISIMVCYVVFMMPSVHSCTCFLPGIRTFDLLSHRLSFSWNTGKWQCFACFSYIPVLHVPMLQWTCQRTKGIWMQWSSQAFKSCFYRHSFHWSAYNCSVSSLLCCPCWILYRPALTTKFTPCRYIFSKHFRLFIWVFIWYPKNLCRNSFE